jgi:hypothetical protein
MKNIFLIGFGVFLVLANIVLTLSCFQITSDKLDKLAMATESVEGAVNSVEKWLSFERNGGE